MRRRDSRVPKRFGYSLAVFYAAEKDIMIIDDPNFDEMDSEENAA